MLIKNLITGLLTACLLGTALVAGAAYPDKPIRLIVPSAPGGSPDVLMRALALELSNQMGVPFIVENKPGASYVIGTMELIRAAPHIEAGRLRAIGISDSQRSPAFPTIPTISESGLTGYEVFAWGGLVGPANMPKDIVERLNKEMRKALASPALLEKFKTFGAAATPSTPEEFLALSRAETKKWAEVIKTSGAKID